MAINYKSHINLDRNELQNAVIHKLAVEPVGGSEGQIYYNSVDKTVYLHDDVAWIPILNLIGVMQVLAGDNVLVDTPTGDVTVSLSPNITGTSSIEFDTTPTNVPVAQGTMSWNDTDGTLDLKLKGGNVTLQIGQEEVVRVINKTGADLLEAEYKVVYISGAQGQRLKVGLPRADQPTTTRNAIGVVTETIADNQPGFINVSGLVNNINTTGALQGETWLEGDVLYLSPTVAGGITKVKPTAPNHSVRIGYCVNAHATQGKIYVKVENGYDLGDLHNVSLTSLTDKNLLAYEASTSLWKNKSLSTLLGGTPLYGGLNVGYVPYAVSSTTGELSNSALYYSGGNFGIGNTTPAFRLDVTGTFKANGIWTDSSDNIFIGNSNTLLAQGLLAWDSTYFRLAALNSSDFQIATTGSTVRFKIVSAGRTLIGPTLGADDGVSSVQVFGRTTIGGPLGADSQFIAYTADGLFNANAEYSYIRTPSNEKRIRFGYADYGGGQYWGRIGFLGGTNWSLGTHGSTGDNFSIGTGFNGSQFEMTSAGNVTFTGTVTGSNGTLLGGTLSNGYVPKATGTSTLGNSLIYDNGSGVSIGSTSVVQTVNIHGTYASLSLNSNSGNFGYGAFYNGATGGALLFGVEGSTGGILAASSTAYSAVINRQGAYNLHLATNDIIRLTIASTGAATFANEVTVGTVLRLASGGYVRSEATYGFTVNDSTDAYNNLILYNNGNAVIRGDVTSGGVIIAGTGSSSFPYLNGKIKADYSQNSTISTQVINQFNGSSAAAYFAVSAYGNSWYFGLGSSTSTYGNDFVLRVDASSNNAPYLRVSSATGLATFSNSIVTNGANASLTVDSSTGTYAQLVYKENGTLKWNAYYSYVNGHYEIANSGGVRFGITSGGNVLINTSTDDGASKLQVAGNISLKGSGAYAGLLVDNTGTTGGGYISLRQNGVVAGLIGVNGAIQGDSSMDLALLCDYAGGGIKFYTNGSPTVKTMITSGGNFLINTTTDAGYKLLVNGTILSYDTITSSGIIQNAVSNSPFTNSAIVKSAASTGMFLANNAVSSWMGVKIDGTLSFNGSAVFNQDITVGESFRGQTADNTSNFASYLTGRTDTFTGAWYMQAGGGSATFGGGLSLFGHSHATKPGWVIAGISSGSGGKFSVNNQGILGSGSDVFTVNGNDGSTYNTTGTYGTISDLRLKENISAATGKLEDLAKVEVINYNLIGDTLKQIGFGAQDLEKIFPALIETDSITGMKQIKSSVFIPILVKAIQELNQKIETIIK